MNFILSAAIAKVLIIQSGSQVTIIQSLNAKNVSKMLSAKVAQRLM